MSSIGPRSCLITTVLLAGCSVLLAPEVGEYSRDDADTRSDGDLGEDASGGDAADGDGDSDVEGDSEPVCGDGVQQAGEACDDGAANSNSEPDACRLDCSAPRCGDGVQDSREACDDGDTIDNDECSNGCVPVLPSLCQPCGTHGECGREQDLCVDVAGARYCSIDCAGGAVCPPGFQCQTITVDSTGAEQCMPEGGQCQTCVDHDGDRYGIGTSCAGPDCDDEDAGVHPGLAETCDGTDTNCSGDEDDSVDAPTWFYDRDGDGFGDPRLTDVSCAPRTGFVVSNQDCDDSNASVNPRATEVCDGSDNNCNGDTDEGCEVPVGTCAGTEPGCAENCALPRSIVAPPAGGSVEARGSTRGARHEYGSTCGGNSSPDHVFAFDVTERADYEIRTADPGGGYTWFDTVLFLRRDCNRSDTTIACNDDIEPSVVRYSLIRRTLDPGRYFIFVDGYRGASGDYLLRVSRPPA